MNPTGADVQRFNPYLNDNPPPDEWGGSSSLYQQLATPQQQRTSYTVDGMPVPVEYFWLRVDSSFQSSFGLLQTVANASRGNYLGSNYSYRDGSGRTLNTNDRATALGWQRETHGEITQTRLWIVSNNWSFATTLIPQVNSNFKEKRVKELLDQINQLDDGRALGIGIHNKSGQDFSIVICQASNESGFVRIQQPDGSEEGIAGIPTADPNLQDLGLFQIQTATANSLGIGTYTREQIRDHEATNTKLATTYLKTLIDKYGDVRTALGLYKQGDGSFTANRRKKGLPLLTKASESYADNILECARRLREAAKKSKG